MKQDPWRNVKGDFRHYVIYFQLEKQRSPLLKDLMLCLKEIMKDYRSEVQGLYRHSVHNRKNTFF